MAVFKAYFKVMRGSVLMLAISLSVFMGLALLFSFVAPGVAIQEFESARTPLAVINRDGEALLARGLANYLAESYQVVSLMMMRKSYKMRFLSQGGIGSFQPVFLPLLWRGMIVLFRKLLFPIPPAAAI